MHFDSIGFDLDGTLWDFTPTVQQAWAEVLQAQGLIQLLPPVDAIRAYAGCTLTELAAIFPSLEQSKALELTCACVAAEDRYIASVGGMLYDGLEEVLSALSQNYRLFLASNCMPGYLHGFLNKYCLNRYFDDAICYGDTNQPKGANIRTVIQRRGYRSTLFVGDTQSDYQAACDARIPFAHAAYGFGRVNASVPSLACLRDLPRLLERDDLF